MVANWDGFCVVLGFCARWTLMGVGPEYGLRGCMKALMLVGPSGFNAFAENLEESEFSAALKMFD